MKLLIPYSLLGLVVGCGAGVTRDPGDPPVTPPMTPPTVIPPGPDQPPPTAAIYKRGSLAPTSRTGGRPTSCATASRTT